MTTAKGARWDAVVIGAGHNGLVAAAYLAKGGLRTLVVERRDRVGGAADTSELAPGVRVPTLALLGMGYTRTGVEWRLAWDMTEAPAKAGKKPVAARRAPATQPATRAARERF